MLLEWRDQDNVEKGRKIGLEQGRAEGRAEGLAEGAKGAERLGKLIAALLAQGRVDDAAKAASDPAERECLMAELGIEAPASN